MGNTLGVGVGVGVGLGLGLGLTVGAAALIQFYCLWPQTHFSLFVHSTEDIDEYSAERLHDAMSYAKNNAMLIQVSNVWIGSTGNVKLKGAHFVTCVHSTEVFLMLHDRIVNFLGQKNRSKKNIILYNLPYKNDWLDTATANAKINQWVVNVKNEYRRTTIDLLRLNRNVRSHLYQYNHDDDIEEILYCEWPMLLIVMENMLHLEGELQDTGIHNKFGQCPTAKQMKDVFCISMGW
ncbi:unnamed protein product [Miscanthus lutarioriparius]|uniref:Uncharacterized protein n=1 Tax=Miscanthus lutarioriparius TaxID=422564 RepID=A0A811SHA9_9POAL|nr:unnamed protein product [Miscanthus lutarioriparius]